MKLNDELKSIETALLVFIIIVSLFNLSIVWEIRQKQVKMSLQIDARTEQAIESFKNKPVSGRESGDGH